jgi:predicted MPP superfamily phosphohydrolase
MTRGEFLSRMGWTAASIPFVAVGYGVFRSLYDFEVREQLVPIPFLPAGLDGIRIAQISDLHAGSFFSEEPIREAVERVNALRPDLLVFTGDFVNHDAAELRLAVRHLQTLSPDIGGFACLGNHDHYARVQDVARAVGETPLTLLVNDNRPLTVNGSRMYVLGTDNTGFRQNYADLTRTTRDIPVREADDDLRILLAHDPSYWDEVRGQRPDIDLTLSGHTHGGQLGFEFGPVKWSLAKMAYPRWAGLYEERTVGERTQYLYVNRGLGTVGPPIRVGIRPEITVLTLVRAERPS